VKRVLLWISLLCSFNSVNAFSGPEICSVRVEQIRTKRNVSLVFASQNIRSPISMFGHTYLVFHNDLDPEADSVVFEYLGITEDQGWIIPKAMFGTLPGRFQINCNYFKQREYDFENRDLWTYSLNLSAETRERLNQIVADSLSSDVDYGFLRSNCAERIFRIILGAAQEPIPFQIFHLPIEGIRHLKKRGLVGTGLIYNSSSLSRLRTSYRKLSRDEKRYFWAAVSGVSLENLSLQTKSAISAYVNFRARREPSPRVRVALYNLKRESESSAPDIAAPKEEPTKSDARNYVMSGYYPRTKTIFLQFSPGVESFWNRPRTKISGSELRFFDVSAFYKNRRFGLNELTLASIDGLSPGDEFEGSFVSRINLGFYSFRPSFDLSMSAARLEMGLGYAISIGRYLNLGALPKVEAGRFQSPEKATWGIDAGVAIRLYSQPLEWLSAEFEGQWKPTGLLGGKFFVRSKTRVTISDALFLGLQGDWAEIANASYSMGAGGVF
jgi:hypothetical protein